MAQRPLQLFTDFAAAVSSTDGFLPSEVPQYTTAIQVLCAKSPPVAQFFVREISNCLDTTNTVHPDLRVSSEGHGSEEGNTLIPISSKTGIAPPEHLHGLEDGNITGLRSLIGSKTRALAAKDEYMAYQLKSQKRREAALLAAKTRRKGASEKVTKRPSKDPHFRKTKTSPACQISEPLSVQWVRHYKKEGLDSFLGYRWISGKDPIDLDFESISAIGVRRSKSSKYDTVLLLATDKSHFEKAYTQYKLCVDRAEIECMIQGKTELAYRIQEID